jgi:Transposase IS66 family
MSGSESRGGVLRTEYRSRHRVMRQVRRPGSGESRVASRAALSRHHRQDALYSGPYRQSERQTQQALEDLYQTEVVLGPINKLRQEVSEALAEPVAEAFEFAHAQAVAHADETGWAQGNSDGNNRERRKAWLWVMVTSGVTVFQVHLNRGQAAAKEWLGKFTGYLVRIGGRATVGGRSHGDRCCSRASDSRILKDRRTR